ncbi:hypothetical protein BJX99DRAFT_259631 [Aspergillus californicus]
MNSVKVCGTCPHEGWACDGNPEGCRGCIRNGFFCPQDFRECPVILQPQWSDRDVAGTSNVSPAQVAHDHAGLIQIITDLYQVLIDMQYIQASDIIQPPQSTLPPLVESVYTPETVALIRLLPHFKTSSVDIAPSETQPIPYLNVEELDTICHPNNPRDPLEHGEGEDWAIPPWMFFITRPRPQKYVSFPHCHIYDTRSKILGRWSETLLPANNPHPYLLDARPAQEVIGEWISAFRSLHWVPSLLGESRISHDILANLQRAQSPPWAVKDNNIYWAQRNVYQECGWPDQFHPGELTRRKTEWIELVRQLSGNNEEAAFYRRAAGDHALLTTIITHSHSQADPNSLTNPLLHTRKEADRRGDVFIWAIQQRRSFMCTLLLRDGANTEMRARNSPDRHGETPLIFAAGTGQTEIVSLLLTHNGVDPELRDWLHRTPLSHAAENGHQNTVDLLLSTPGVNPNSRDKHGSPLLFHAARGGHTAIVQTLLPLGTINSDDIHSAFLAAVQSGRHEVVRLLIP